MMKQQFSLMLGVVSVVSLVVALGVGQQAAAQSSGKQAYDQVCARCHATGMLGAPKVGSESAWASRIKKGKQALYQNAINGIGIIMPPKGGSTLPDSQVKAAVDYMLAQVSHGGGGGGGDHGRAR
jgi:cytochrome c5